MWIFRRRVCVLLIFNIFNVTVLIKLGKTLMIMDGKLLSSSVLLSFVINIAGWK